MKESRLNMGRVAFILLLLSFFPVATRAGGPHVIARHAPGPVAVHHRGGMAGGHRVVGPHWGGAWQGAGWHGGYRHINYRHSGCWGNPGWYDCGPRRGCAPVVYFGGWYQPWNYFGWNGIYGTNIFSVQPMMIGPWDLWAAPFPFGVVQADVPWVDPVVDAMPARPARRAVEAAVARVDDEPRGRDVARTPIVASTPAGRQRAGRSLEQGDDLFARGRYLEALQKYKTAASYAGDQGQPYVRQAVAYIAAKKYDRAASALRRGLEIEPQIAGAGFRLNSLYGDERATKEEHLEAMAQTALDQPRNADLLFLIGVFLHYDGEVERADRFLARAAQLLPLGESLEIALFRPARMPPPSVARSTWR